jgi:cytochrome c
MRTAFSFATAAALLLAACDRHSSSATALSLGGDPQRGKSSIERYGCAACHTIPGVRNAVGLVGPNLDQIAVRNYIGGVADNTPENMIYWIENPQALSPKSAMPNLYVTEADARDIASYLYTLR